MEALLQIGWFVGIPFGIIGLVLGFKYGMRDFADSIFSTAHSTVMVMLTTLMGAMVGYMLGAFWPVTLPIAIVYGVFYFIVRKAN